MHAVRCAHKVSASRRLCSLGKLRQKSGFFVEHFKPFSVSPDTYFACVGTSLIMGPVRLPASNTTLSLRNNELCSDVLNNALLSENLQIMLMICGSILWKQEKNPVWCAVLTHLQFKAKLSLSGFFYFGSVVISFGCHVTSHPFSGPFYLPPCPRFHVLTHIVVNIHCCGHMRRIESTGWR